MAEYTPTTYDVRERYEVGGLGEDVAQFDRWLAACEAQVRERIAQDIEDLPSRTVTGVPHDAAYIREHAARIARGATR